MRKYDRVWVEIDLDAIEKNVQEMKRVVSEANENPPMLCGVVKADGYGHGGIPVAKTIEKDVWGYAVATVDEALQIRHHGIEKPVLVLGYVSEMDYEECIREQVRVCLYDEVEIEPMTKAVDEYRKKTGKKDAVMMIHVKLDTGMGRIGFLCAEEEQKEHSVNIIKKASLKEELCLEGCLMHFSKADETDKTFANIQHQRFMDMIERLKKNGVEFKICHCDNSAGIIDLPQWGQNMVRMGISLYGMYPSDEVDQSKIDLTPALSMKSHIVFEKRVPKGTPIGYGGSFVTERESLIGTIPVGYGDGYPRNLSNKGYVLVRGQKAPIIGRVCMDQFMIDLTDIEGAKRGDLVTLIGTDGKEKISVEEIAALAGTFNYEFVCDLGKRIPRVFMKSGKAQFTKDYFDDHYDMN